MRSPSPMATVLLVVLGCDSGPAAAPAPSGEAKQEAPEAARVTAPELEPSQPEPHTPTVSDDLEQARAGSLAGPPSAPPDPIPGDDTTLLLIEARSPVARAGKIVLNVGAEALPGRLSPTLTIGCEAPCWQPALVWPGPGETSVEVTLFRSSDLRTSGATSLGTFRIDSVPPPADGKRVEVVLALGVVDGDLHAHAHVHDSGDALPLSKIR